MLQLKQSNVECHGKMETLLFLCYMNIIWWASSWDYGTFCPPYTHSSNTHAQPSSGARCLMFGLTLRLLLYFMCANSEHSGETAQMHRLAWALAGRLCDKYHNLICWLIWCILKCFNLKQSNVECHGKMETLLFFVVWTLSNEIMKNLNMIVRKLGCIEPFGCIGILAYCLDQ